MSTRGGRRMRLRGLLRKELLQVLRDPSSIAIAFLLPVLLLFIFGYGVSLDVRDVPVAVVVDAPDAATESLVAAFRGSRYFQVTRMQDAEAARRALEARRVRAVVRLAADFSADLRRPGGARIQVLVNGVDANTARLVRGYVRGVWRGWLEAEARARGAALGEPVRLVERVWFNREVRSRNYLVPGLIAVIMTLIGALLTALVVAREWERGTLEALLVTPVSMGEILVGKLLPYFILGMGGMALSVFLALFLFQVPLRGSVWVLFGAAALFLLAALGMGLLISILTRNQFVAGLLAIITTFLPAFMLSGFIFDLESTPAAIQAVSHVIAARYFVAILQTVFNAGDLWSVILPNAAALAVLALVFLGLGWRRARKRLE